MIHEKLCSPKLQVIKSWNNSPVCLSQAIASLTPYLNLIYIPSTTNLPRSQQLKTRDLEYLARMFYNGDADKNGVWDELEVSNNIGKHSESTANYLISSLHINNRNPLTFSKYISMVLPETTQLPNYDIDSFYLQQCKKFNYM